MSRGIVCAVVVVCCITCVSVAGVPQLVNYQGRLTNATGKPVDTVKAMTFEFYDAEEAGALLGSFSETQNIAVTNGVFNLLIGSATVGGVPLSVFQGENVYLSVKVEGQQLTPRQRIATVGFAAKAAEADHASYADLAGSALNALSATQAGKADWAASVAPAYDSGWVDVVRGAGYLVFLRLHHGLGGDAGTYLVRAVAKNYNDNPPPGCPECCGMIVPLEQTRVDFYYDAEQCVFEGSPYTPDPFMIRVMIWKRE